MTVRAKFTVVEIKQSKWHGDNKVISTIVLSPVTGSGSEENKKFWAYTPAGRIELGTINPEAAQAFELGKEYYIDFTPAQ